MSSPAERTPRSSFGTACPCFIFECPRDPAVTTVLSMTAHSLIVFRSHARHVGEGDNGPEVLSVHILPEEIDPALADVKAVEGLLHVYLPKKNNKGWRQKNGGHKYAY